VQRMAIRVLAVVTVFALVLGATAPSQARIEAIKGKRYRLTKRHGPWMIMVASLHSIPGRSPTAEEAADELVYELRRKGIPAYVYKQEAAIDRIKTVDRFGRPQQRAYRARDNRICVLAGNYPSVKDRIAQKTLQYIKTLRPKFWEEHGIYRKTPGRPGPLSGAFLTINPLLSPEEIAKKKRDALILRLNSGVEYSLLQNKGKYTLVVATFMGKSTTHIGDRGLDEVAEKFKVGSTLDQAAEDAQQLVHLLRSQRAKEMLNPNLIHLLDNDVFDAYVFHDRYHSIVTVGAFSSPNDPRIPELIQVFGAKPRQDPATGRTVLTGEMITIPGRRPTDPPVKTFLFDPYPRVIEVPKPTRIAQRSRR